MTIPGLIKNYTNKKNLEESIEKSVFTNIGQWSMIFSIFFMPLNKPLTNIFLFLALLFSLAGKNFYLRLKTSIKEPVALSCIVWLLIFSGFALHEYSSTESWSELSAFKALFYPLIASTLFISNDWRRRGLLAFFISALLVLSISWIQFLASFLFHNNTALSASNQYTVAKDYSQQALMTLVLFSLVMAFSKHDSFKKYQAALRIVAGLAIINVMLVLQSRTSYIVAVPLLMFWLYQILKRSDLKIKISIAFLTAIILIGFFASPRAQHRMQEVKSDITSYLKNNSATSVGIRIELWRRSIPIIVSAPMLGHGLGQWKVQYENQTKGLKNFEGFEMKHPHQESIWLLSEQGIIGYLIYLTLLFYFFIYTRRLPEAEKNFYRSLLIVYIFFGLANCVLLDFSHRHLFILLLCCVPLALKSLPVLSPGKKSE